MSTIEQLLQTIATQQRVIEEQRKEILLLKNTIADLSKEIADLKEKLGTNSNNSSTSPSQDPYRSKQKRHLSPRSPGGQLGHQGYLRKLFPPERVQHSIDVYPKICPNCGTTTFQSTPVRAHKLQVVELPQIQPIVSQYNCYTCKCNNCGKHVSPAVPKEAQRGFGPRLMGFIEVLAGEARATKRVIVTVLGHLGIPISSGSVSNIHKLTSDLLEGPYDLIRKDVLANNMNADETSWYKHGKRKWLWIGTGATATFLQIHPSRSIQACNHVFSGFKNIVTSDRYAAYNALGCARQLCWSHLDRDFEKIEERGDVDEIIGRALKHSADSVFQLWRDYKLGKLTRKELQSMLEDTVISSTESAFKAGALAGQSKTQNTCLNILSCFEMLWTFAYHDNVEPTNNLAERDLRPVVIWRKITAGSRSEWGEHYTERIFSVISTLKKRAKDVFEYFTECFFAWQREGPIPNPL